MKKLIVLVFTFAILILLVGCQNTTNQSTDTVLKAWSGEFSEKELKLAIKEYQNNYINIVLEKDSASSVSFETDFEVSSCSVSRLSRIDDTDIDVELNSYIDLFVETGCDGRIVTVPIDWWYANGDSWVNDYLLWSYLVRVKDVNGNSYYYYFRVDYSACEQHTN